MAWTVSIGHAVSLDRKADANSVYLVHSNDLVSNFVSLVNAERHRVADFFDEQYADGSWVRHLTRPAQPRLTRNTGL